MPVAKDVFEKRLHWQNLISKVEYHAGRRHELAAASLAVPS